MLGKVLCNIGFKAPLRAQRRDTNLVNKMDQVRF